MSGSRSRPTRASWTFSTSGATLADTAILVTNGGWGGVLEGLSAGVPLVVAGGDIDKPENAARVARSGAGIDLRTGHPRPAAIAKAIIQLLDDPSYARRAGELGAELDQLGGAATAADLIEELNRTRATVRRGRLIAPIPTLRQLSALALVATNAK